MNYDQSAVDKGKNKGTCAWYAVLGAIVDRYGLETPQEVLEAFIDASGRRESSVIWILEYLKTHPFEGYKSPSKGGREIIYNKKLEARLHAPAMEKIRHLALTKDKAVLVSVPIYHKESPKIHLDDEYVFETSDKPVIESHAVYMEEMEGSMKIRMVNSWGTDFGLEGKFFLTMNHFHKDVTAVYSASFEKVT